MTSITTEYHEKIQIPTHDVIPKSRAFNWLKYSILSSLIILIIFAIISAIIAESFVSQNKKDALTIGIVAVVSLCFVYVLVFTFFPPSDSSHRSGYVCFCWE